MKQVKNKVLLYCRIYVNTYVYKEIKTKKEDAFNYVKLANKLSFKTIFQNVNRHTVGKWWITVGKWLFICITETLKDQDRSFRPFLRATTDGFLI